MKIEQLYTGCIAQAAYYLESNGEAAIFDPLREVQPYLDKAQKDNAQIKYIFETHFHADFVSGHLDLAQKSGGKIVYGPTAKPEFEAIIAEDNQEFTVGNYTIKALHTPGHTLESTCYLLMDENGKQHGNRRHAFYWRCRSSRFGSGLGRRFDSGKTGVVSF